MSSHWEWSLSKDRLWNKRNPMIKNPKMILKIQSSTHYMIKKQKISHKTIKYYQTIKLQLFKIVLKW